MCSLYVVLMFQKPVNKAEVSEVVVKAPKSPELPPPSSPENPPPSFVPRSPDRPPPGAFRTSPEDLPPSRPRLHSFRAVQTFLHRVKFLVPVVPRARLRLSLLLLYYIRPVPTTHHRNTREYTLRVARRVLRLRSWCSLLARLNLR